MKLRGLCITGMLFAIVTATAAFAPPASADRDRCDDGHRSSGRRARAASWDRWDDDSRHRSYFYQEVATGRTHSHISAFKPYGHRRGGSPVEKIDRRSGRVIAAYIWDGNSWEDCDRGDYARYDRHDRSDRRGRGGWYASIEGRF